jgi:tRNA A-37 threonylcarbamoyl transferase component Bud32/tetratricopeptide (TPR) repeat protein
VSDSDSSFPRDTQPAEAATEPTRVERPISGRLPRDQRALPPAEDDTPQVGRTIGSVRLEAVIGRGGMGEVYRGFDQQLGRQVAVKTVRLRDGESATARERLRREARILSKLNHPGICQLYELLQTEHRDWLVLELVEGLSLRTVIERGALDRNERFHIAEGIVEALAVAHRHGIVHRDLKAENIMLPEQGGIKILDFGIARADLEDPDGQILPTQDPTAGTGLETIAGTVLGTTRYMSPEQARGEPVSTASDIYSTGLLIEELWLGPVGAPEGTSAVEAVQAIATRRPLRLKRLPRRLARLIARCGALEPGERPTAAELLAGLRRERERPRRLALRAAAFLTALLVILGALKYTLDLRRSEQTAHAAQDRAEALVGFLLEDLQGQLEPLGRLDLIEGVAQRALEHFRSLADLEGVSHGPHAALARRQIGGVLAKRGEIDPALVLLREALAIDQELLDRDETAEALAAVAEDHHLLGLAIFDTGDAAGAGVELGQARRTLERALVLDPNPRWRRELTRVLAAEADLARHRGDTDAAGRLLEEGLSTLSELHRNTPDDRDTTATLAELHYSAGLIAHFERNDPTTAHAHYRDAVALLESLIDEHHEDAGHRYRLAVLYGQGLCQAALDRGEVEAAAIANQRALTELTRLHREDPTNGRYGNALVWEGLRHVDLAILRGDRAEALAAANAAVALAERMFSGPNRPTQWRGTLAYALRSLAELLADDGRWAQALVHLRRAEEIHLGAAAERGDNMFAVMDLLGVRSELLDVLLETGDVPTIAALLPQIRVQHGQLSGRLADNVLLQEAMVSSLVATARAARLLGDQDGFRADLAAVFALVPRTESESASQILLEGRLFAELLSDDRQAAKRTIEQLLDQGWVRAAASPAFREALQEQGL